MQERSEIERLEKTLISTMQAIGSAKNALDSLSALAAPQLEAILSEISSKFVYYEAEIDRLRRENEELRGAGSGNLSELPRANMGS
ncbi:MAG TPA: hypothetical protein P5539_08845 [Mesotoga sp.]|nr:hypothetical protein [Mesotoga sp.]